MTFIAFLISLLVVCFSPLSFAQIAATTLSPIRRPTFQTTPRNVLPTECGKSITTDDLSDPLFAPKDAYPWHVSLGFIEPNKNEPSYVCVGTVITSRYVLTAASCSDGGELKVARARGIECRPLCSSLDFEFGIEKTIKHFDANLMNRIENDIALVRLKNKLNFNEGWIMPICLTNQFFNVHNPPRSPNPVVTGWGSTHTGTHMNSSALIRLEVPFVSIDKCKTVYPNQITKHQICAGGDGIGQGICILAGGALTLKNIDGTYQQIGIVSFGPHPCGKPGFPDGYTFIGAYIDWINQVINQ